jgi:hypothetical protein
MSNVAARTTTTTGASGLTLLGILFIGLKLASYINWSWWWVTAPFWGPFVAVIVFFVCGFISIAALKWFSTK